MKLINLSVSNIASYRFIEVNFESINYPAAIYGDNGAGKTTLFVDSVTAALYGVAYGSSRFINDLRGRGPTGEVALEFEVNGDRYKVVRRIHKDRANEAYLYILSDNRWKPIAVGTSEVNNKINEIIGIDYRALMNSAIVRQGEVHELIEAKRADRAEILLKLLKFDLSKYSEEAKEKVKILSNRLSELKGKKVEIEKNICEEQNVRIKIDELNRRKDKLESKIRGLLEELSKYKEREEELLRELSEVNKIIGGLESLIDRLTQLEKMINEINNRINEFKGKFKALNIDEELAYGIAKYWDKIKSYRECIDEVEQLRSIIDKLSEIKASLSKEEVLNNLKKEYSELRSSLESLSNRKAVIQHKLDEAGENIKLLKQSSLYCPLCGVKLTREHREHRLKILDQEIASLKDELKAIDEEIIKKSSLIVRIEDEINLINEEISKAKSIASLLCPSGDVDLEIKDRGEELNEKMTIKNKLENEIRTIFLGIDFDIILKNYNMMLSNIPDFNEYIELIRNSERLHDEHNVLLKEVSEYQERVQAKRALELKLREIKDKVLKLDNEVSKLNEELGGVKGELKYLTEKLMSIQRDKDRLKNLIDEIKDLETDIEAYKVLAETFSWRGLPLALLRKYLDDINYLTNRYLEDFEQNISMKLEIGEEAGKPTIELITYRDNVKANPNTLSNGEKILLGFALRLALNDIISRMYYGGKRPRFFIIDEGFGPLDSENRRRVAWALYTLIRDGKYDQLFIISHAEGLWEEEIFKTRIEVFKEAGISRIIIT